MEKVAAVAQRECDVEGRWTVREGGTSVWVGSMLEWGVHTMGEGTMQMESVGPRWRGPKPIGGVGAA